MIFDLLSLVLIVLTVDCCEFICACVLKFVGATSWIKVCIWYLYLFDFAAGAVYLLWRGA